MADDVNVDALAEEYYKDRDPAFQDAIQCSECGRTDAPMNWHYIHGEKRWICKQCWNDAKLRAMVGIEEMAKGLLDYQKAALAEMIQSGEICEILDDKGDL